MTKSCKSQGKRNKTMKKNTKKMQGGLPFVGPDPTSSDASQVLSAKVNPIDAPKVNPIDAPKVDPIDAPKVDPNSTTTAAEPESQNSFFSMFKLPNVFGTSEGTPSKKGGKRKSKSNKSYKKKSKYNKK